MGNGAELVKKVGWTFSELILAISTFKTLILAYFFYQNQDYRLIEQS